MSRCCPPGSVVFGSGLAVAAPLRKARSLGLVGLLVLVVSQLLGGPATAMSSLEFDLSDPGSIPLRSGEGQYSVILDQPSAEPTFTFSVGDVIHMQGRATFNDLAGGDQALLVFTSFRQAPSVACGAGAPSPSIAVSPGADVSPGPATHQGSAVITDPDGTICSAELGGEPFLAMVFDEATEGEVREFAFDLVLEAPMDEAAGMRVLYKGYAVVPEPSVVALLVVGLPLLVRFGRRS